MNLMQSNSITTSAASFLSQGQQHQRNPLFNRDRGGGGGIPPSAAFDPSDFPSLGQAGSGPGGANPIRSNYVGMVRQPARGEAGGGVGAGQEFQMSHEDFPALPGAGQPGNNDRMTNQGLHQVNDTEVFGSTGSVGDGHFVRYSRKSVTLGFFNAKSQFGDRQNVSYSRKSVIPESSTSENLCTIVTLGKRVWGFSPIC